MGNAASLPVRHDADQHQKYTSPADGRDVHASLAKALQQSNSQTSSQPSSGAPRTPSGTLLEPSAMRISPLVAGTSATSNRPATVRAPCACAHLHPGKTCISFVVSSFGRAFYLAYGIRAGISLVLHIIKLLRSKEPLKVFNLNELVSAQGLPIDAVRMGLFLGGFTGIYNGLRCLFARLTGRDDKLTIMGAGALAGLSILWQDRSSHRTLALYAWARVFQCWYNKAKADGAFHFWGSHPDWKHGDTLLFSLCSAQVMYSYVMRPDTLPYSYWRFIVDTGPIPMPILAASKANLRGLPIDLPSVKTVYDRLAPRGSKPVEEILARLAKEAYGPNASPLIPPILPCSVLHPQNPHCHHQWFETFLNGAKRSMPLYLSLTFVPMIVLRFWLVVKHPLDQLGRGLFSVTRSTSFISCFVTAYMFLICNYRRVFKEDHRYVYWLAGFISSWSLLLEQKSRRSELALYVLPRALDSLIQTLQSRRLLASIPHGEQILFCLGMGALMTYREYHADTMSPFLRRVLNFFVPSAKSMPHAHGKRLAPSANSTDLGVTPGQMVREESDGLSAQSINSVIPLPQPGISLSREQSFSSLAPNGAPATGSSSLRPIASEYNLIPSARDLSPQATPTAGRSPNLEEAEAGPTTREAAREPNTVVIDDTDDHAPLEPVVPSPVLAEDLTANEDDNLRAPAFPTMLPGMPASTSPLASTSSAVESSIDANVFTATVADEPTAVPAVPDASVKSESHQQEEAAPTAPVAAASNGHASHTTAEGKKKGKRKKSGK